MRSLKKDVWKVAKPLAGLLLFFGLMPLILISAVDAHAGALQPTPTVDLTVTALAKEQLALQVKQLQNQTQDQITGLPTTLPPSLQR